MTKEDSYFWNLNRTALFTRRDTATLLLKKAVKNP